MVRRGESEWLWRFASGAVVSFLLALAMYVLLLGVSDDFKSFAEHPSDGKNYDVWLWLMGVVLALMFGTIMAVALIPKLKLGILTISILGSLAYGLAVCACVLSISWKGYTPVGTGFAALVVAGMIVGMLSGIVLWALFK